MTASLSEPLLSIENVTKHYPLGKGLLDRRKGVVKAVDGISLSVEQGRTHGIVGESGCGKSTLARLLVSLEAPSSGSIKYRGQDIASMSKHDLRTVRRNVQIVMQDPYSSLNPRMTVGEIVNEPFAIHSDVLAVGKRRAKVRELLELVGLNPDFEDRYPHQFSGGQRQRIGIARGLALDPEVLVCDEAVSALDVSVQAQVLNLLRSLQGELGLSYVFIAHDLSVVRQICSDVTVMYLGRVAETGFSSDVYASPQHPYTKALLSAVPRTDPRERLSRQRIVLSGDLPSPANPPLGCRFSTRCPMAQEICRTVEPELVELEGSKHRSACHFNGVLVPGEVAARS